jgi:hypothetical protein
MADSTTHLGLATINRSTEAATTLVGTWIDTINDVNGGNMTKIDAAYGKLMTEGSAYKTSITGDGAKTAFSITHNKNTAQPSVTVYDVSAGSVIYPEVVSLNTSQVSVRFLYPVPVGRVYNVTVS